ncbi:MAG: 3-phosphoshikimate 1-carboxyvinyltransferase [Treponema sp.]|nr:3-phosphoshikimate 1-carboxyvinyltransferase [Treponema sp.]
MKIKAKKTSLSGHIQVPGSKSHTIRALLLASLAEGTSRIHNPLPSADCISTSKAISLVGAFFKDEGNGTWTVTGAGKNIHLPENVVDVGNSGSLLYFMSPIAATFEGWSIFTGDESIRTRPVAHMVDVLNQMGGEAHIAIPGKTTCPMVIKGPVSTRNRIVTEGSVSSQYISGLMMAATRMKGTLKIELTNPKETPYLTMTKIWLESVGVTVRMSDDFKHIEIDGPVDIKAFEKTIPSDWEAVAFPLIAALITDSEITIDDVDSSGTQGDDAIVDVLKSIGADIQWDKTKNNLTVRGGKKSADKIGRLSTDNLPGKELHVNLSGYPDAICAVAVAACFTEGTTYIEDISVCRKKETDRIEVLKKELTKLGADVEDGPDFMIIHGHSPLNSDGTKNPDFRLHGAEVESCLDHRVAMSLACLGLGLDDGNEVIVKDAECCSVSFPGFFDVMNNIKADFEQA